MPDNLNLNLNLDQNLDLNLGAMGSGGIGLGPRYNTDDFCRLAPPPAPAVVPPTPYAPSWDAEHRAWPFVREFIMGGGWAVANDPVGAVTNELRAQPFFAVPQLVNLANPVQYVAGANTAATPLTAPLLAAELLGVLNASIDRADRAGEILYQASALGALSYWTGMLRINPATDTNTVLLIRVARKIGEFVAMGVKARFGMRRPAQVNPWILPLIDGPDTPSYPSSHALQAFLISEALKLALPGAILPPAWPPAPVAWPPFVPPGLPAPPNETAQALDHLAYRIAYNREVAGVHYRMDGQAGKYAAFYCIARLQAARVAGTVPLFNALVVAAAGELANRP